MKLLTMKPATIPKPKPAVHTIVHLKHAGLLSRAVFIKCERKAA